MSTVTLEKDTFVSDVMSDDDKFDFDNDPLGLKRFEFDELAISAVSTMMGFTSTDIFNEEKKEKPDQAKIDELRKALIVMRRERQEIYSGNIEVKRSVIERYCPIIRERVSNAR
jgi:hypothetical protein